MTGQILDTTNPLFTVVAEGIQTGVLVIDRELRIRYWNRWFSQYTGLELQAHLGHVLSDVFPLIKEYERERVFHQVIETRQARFLSPRFHPAVFVENDGLPRFHYLRLLPILDPAADEALGIITVIEDLTNTIEFERSLRESEMLFRTTLFSIGDGVMVIGTDGRLQHMNQAAERLSGWSEEDARGQPLEAIFRLVDERTRAQVESPLAEVLAGGAVVTLADHVLLIAKNGTEIPIADSAAPIRTDQGVLKGVVLVFRDQSEERAAQKALHALNADLDERVRERTENLNTLVNAMAGREVRMGELKKVIKKLRAQLQEAGIEPVADDPLFGS